MLVNFLKIFFITQFLNKWFLYSCCGVYVIQAICGLVAGKNFVDPFQKWTPSYWYTQLISLAKYAFFFGNRPDLTSSQKSFTWLDHFLGIVWSCTMLFRYMIGFCGDLCLLTMSLTLWTTAYSFEQNVLSEMRVLKRKSIPTCVMESTEIPVDTIFDTFSTNQYRNAYRSWSNLYDQYKAIHELSRLINKAMGSLMTCYLGESVMYYSVNCNKIIVARDLYTRIHLIFFYFNILTIFLLSADICHRVTDLTYFKIIGNRVFVLLVIWWPIV